MPVVTETRGVILRDATEAVEVRDGGGDDAAVQAARLRVAAHYGLDPNVVDHLPAHVVLRIDAAVVVGGVVVVPAVVTTSGDEPECRAWRQWYVTTGAIRG